METGQEHNGEYYDPNVVNDDFPREEAFECWDGKERTFIISCLQFPGIGFQVEAVEKGKDRMGYEFAAHHATSPYVALGELRRRMHWELSKRYISMRKKPPGDEAYFPLHDTLEGRITVDERGLPAFVIDGILIKYENFLGMFEMHEGWKFKICFAELSEAFPDH